MQLTINFEDDNKIPEMSSYFRWIKSGKKDDRFGAKPRSRSLDTKSLEASGIRLILQNVH